MIKLLDVSCLNVGFLYGKCVCYAVNSVTFSAARGEVLGIVGESGSGKSLTALALMGLLPAEARVEGIIRLNKKVLWPAKKDAWAGVRGRKIGMVFQEPMTCLNPVMSIGRQVCEALEVNDLATGARAEEKTLALFKKFAIEPPKIRFKQYPHQLSGGLRQRVMLAMALACEPELLLADEPTTALDLTIQAQILGLLEKNVRENSTTLILITHDLGVIARMADRVLVMLAGRIIEEAPVDHIFHCPSHPYTRHLLDSTLCLDNIPADRNRIVVPVEVEGGQGCAFAPRCLRRLERCSIHMPAAGIIGQNHYVYCFNPLWS